MPTDDTVAPSQDPTLLPYTSLFLASVAKALSWFSSQFVNNPTASDASLYQVNLIESTLKKIFFLFKVLNSSGHIMGKQILKGNKIN